MASTSSTDRSVDAVEYVGTSYLCLGIKKERSFKRKDDEKEGYRLCRKRRKSSIHIGKKFVKGLAISGRIMYNKTKVD